MTTQTERVSDERLRELLERVKAATEGSSAVDAELAEAFGLYPALFTFKENRGFPMWFSRSGQSWKAPSFSSSIDAVLALVERLLPGASVNMLQVAKSCNAAVFPEGAGMMPTQVAATLPLAILAALLSALTKEPVPHV